MCFSQVKEDPLEKTNQAASQPAVVARLMTQLEAYTAKAYTGGLDQAKTDQEGYCKWITRAGWVQPFE